MRKVSATALKPRDGADLQIGGAKLSVKFIPPPPPPPLPPGSSAYPRAETPCPKPPPVTVWAINLGCSSPLEAPPPPGQRNRKLYVVGGQVSQAAII